MPADRFETMDRNQLKAECRRLAALAEQFLQQWQQEIEDAISDAFTMIDKPAAYQAIAVAFAERRRDLLETDR